MNTNYEAMRKAVVAARSTFGKRYKQKAIRADVVSSHEDYINTFGERRTLDQMVEEGYLYKPAGSSRYYVRCDNIIPKQSHTHPATHRPFADLLANHPLAN